MTALDKAGWAVFTMESITADKNCQWRWELMALTLTVAQLSEAVRLTVSGQSAPALSRHRYATACDGYGDH